MRHGRFHSPREHSVVQAYGLVLVFGVTVVEFQGVTAGGFYGYQKSVGVAPRWLQYIPGLTSEFDSYVQRIPESIHRTDDGIYASGTGKAPAAHPVEKLKSLSLVHLDADSVGIAGGNPELRSQPGDVGRWGRRQTGVGSRSRPGFILPCGLCAVAAGG